MVSNVLCSAKPNATVSVQLLRSAEWFKSVGFPKFVLLFERDMA